MKFRLEGTEFTRSIARADLVAHGVIFSGLGFSALLVGIYLTIELTAEQSFQELGIHVISFILFGFLAVIWYKSAYKAVVRGSVVFCMTTLFILRYAYVLTDKYDLEVYPEFAILYISVFSNFALLVWMIFRTKYAVHDEKKLFDDWQQIIKLRGSSQNK